MLVFTKSTPKSVAPLFSGADTEICRCFACCHHRFRETSPRRASLLSWRRLAVSLRYGADRPTAHV